jgi:hypothetical protein
MVLSFDVWMVFFGRLAIAAVSIVSESATKPEPGCHKNKEKRRIIRLFFIALKNTSLKDELLEPS